MPVGVHSGTSQQAIKFTSVAGPELRPRYEKLARLRETAQFVSQDALKSRKSIEIKLACFLQSGRLKFRQRICADKTVITVSTVKAGSAKGVSNENLIGS